MFFNLKCSFTLSRIFQKKINHLIFSTSSDQVLHPISMQPAIRSNIPVRVKNSYNPKAPGRFVAVLFCCYLLFDAALSLYNCIFKISRFQAISSCSFISFEIQLSFSYLPLQSHNYYNSNKNTIATALLR